MSQGALVEIGAWVADLYLQDIDISVTLAAKNCIVDVTGVGFAAQREAIVVRTFAHALAHYGEGPCEVIGSHQRLSAVGAALANGVASHALDFDDTSYAGILHGSAVIWPASFAVAQAAGSTGADLLAGFIAGSEVQYALGSAMTEAFYGRGWWTTATLGAIGAAVAAARTMRASPEIVTHALAIAVSQAFGTRSLLGTMAKPYACGRAAQVGVDAALAAKLGILGPLNALSDQYGFGQVLGGRPFPEHAFERLGQEWSLLDPGVAFKLFPVCSAAQTATELVVELLRDNQLVRKDVAAVECEVPPLVSESLRYHHPKTVDQARFSMPFAIGSILAFGKLGPDELNDDVVFSSDLTAEMAKVSMETREDLAATKAQRRDGPESAAVTIVTRDGRRLKRFRATATGMPQTPMTRKQIDAKYTRCASTLMDKTRSDELLSRLRTLEKSGNPLSLFR